MHLQLGLNITGSIICSHGKACCSTSVYLGLHSSMNMVQGHVAEGARGQKVS